MCFCFCLLVLVNMWKSVLKTTYKMLIMFNFDSMSLSELANAGRPLFPGNDVDDQLKRIFRYLFLTPFVGFHNMCLSTSTICYARPQVCLGRTVDLPCEQ